MAPGVPIASSDLVSNLGERCDLSQCLSEGSWVFCRLMMSFSQQRGIRSGWWWHLFECFDLVRVSIVAAIGTHIFVLMLDRLVQEF